ncbi:MAG: hypothetical protein F6K28_26980, partial [Microcoleus sp. SIO2G3]|nr:hypothetical protein [Microcoleus sp. SIO2G3]
MSQKKTEKPTPEQESLIPFYQDKWRNIALSTEPINRKKATSAVKEAYALMGLSEPKILFIDSPSESYNIAFLGLLFQELDNS